MNKNKHENGDDRTKHKDGERFEIKRMRRGARQSKRVFGVPSFAPSQRVIVNEKKAFEGTLSGYETADGRICRAANLIRRRNGLCPISSLRKPEIKRGRRGRAWAASGPELEAALRI